MRLRPHVRFFVLWMFTVMMGQFTLTRAAELIPNRFLSLLVWWIGTTYWLWWAFLYVVSHTRTQVLKEIESGRAGGTTSLN